MIAGKEGNTTLHPIWLKSGQHIDILAGKKGMKVAVALPLHEAMAHSSCFEHSFLRLLADYYFYNRTLSDGIKFHNFIRV